MWTIDELVERVRTALAAEYPGAPNGRVRDLPDRRAIRWYTTTGLVDRPSMRGRTAFYDERHLLQLVALKRRQAAGRTLAEIQAELTGATDRMLLDIARIPAGQVVIAEDFARHDPAAPVRPRFWAERGAGAPPVAVAGPGAGRARPEAVPLAGIALGGGAVLLVPGSPAPDDHLAIADAARPLFDLLAARGLLHPDPPHPEASAPAVTTTAHHDRSSS